MDRALRIASLAEEGMQFARISLCIRDTTALEIALQLFCTKSNEDVLDEVKGQKIWQKWTHSNRLADLARMSM